MAVGVAEAAQSGHPSGSLYTQVKRSDAMVNPGGGSGAVTLHDVQKVHYLIECCLLRSLSKEQTVATLEHYGVQPAFTRIVWAKLEEQNPAYFSEYNRKLQTLVDLETLTLRV